MNLHCNKKVPVSSFFPSMCKKVNIFPFFLVFFTVHHHWEGNGANHNIGCAFLLHLKRHPTLISTNKKKYSEMTTGFCFKVFI